MHVFYPMTALWSANWKVTVTLTFDLLTLKALGAIYCCWVTSIKSLKILGQSILKLLNENHLVYRSTDRQTAMCKAIYLLFKDGDGHYKLLTIFLLYIEADHQVMTKTCLFALKSKIKWLNYCTFRDIFGSFYVFDLWPLYHIWPWPIYVEHCTIKRACRVCTHW